MKSQLFLSLGVLITLGEIRTCQGDVEGENSVCKMLSPAAIVQIAAKAMKATLPWKAHCFVQEVLTGLYKAASQEVKIAEQTVGAFLNAIRDICEAEESLTGFKEFTNCVMSTSSNIDIDAVGCFAFWRATKCVPHFVTAVKEFLLTLPEAVTGIAGDIVRGE